MFMQMFVIRVIAQEMSVHAQVWQVHKVWLYSVTDV